MRNPIRFEQGRTRRLFSLHRLRVLHILAGLPRSVRTGLANDLDDHLLEIYHHIEGADEHARLQSALTRLGDPSEFLAPLVGEALFERQTRPDSLMTSIRQGAALAMSGATNLSLLVVNMIFGAAGLVLTLIGLGTLARPGRSGVFEIAPGEFHARIWGAVTEEQSILPLWGGLLIMLSGLAVLYLVQKWLRQAALKLIANSFAHTRKDR